MHEYLKKIETGDFDGNFLEKALKKIGEEEYTLHELRSVLIEGLKIKGNKNLKSSSYDDYEFKKISDLSGGKPTTVYGVDIPTESAE